MGANKKFISLQRFYKYKIPLWFFNMDELIENFKPKYEIIFVSNYLHKYFGKFQEIPMKNLPKKFRIGHTKTLIFKKKS